MDLESKIKKLYIPIFFMVGSKDTFVNPTHTKKLYENLMHKNKDLYMFDGDHNSKR